jgi:hypothetical protein
MIASACSTGFFAALRMTGFGEFEGFEYTLQ